MSRFSQREGFTPADPPLSPHEMPAALRNGLWNAALQWGLHEDHAGSYDSHRYKPWRALTNHVLCEFLKYRVDTLPYHPQDRREMLGRDFLQMNPYRTYDFLEFLSEVSPDLDIVTRGNSFLVDECNRVLARELAPVRFIGGVLTLITRGEEIDALKAALQSADEQGLSGVTAHLTAAMRHLRHRPHPDTRNSVKESISAVEAVARRVPGGANTLGDALQELRKSGAVPDVLTRGFEKLYAWTNGPSGIRHALMDESEVGLPEAQFMLISCSAFAAYLMQKGKISGQV